MQPIRTTHGVWHSATNFQACVDRCFSELRATLLEWLDDFALFDQSEEGLLAVLSTFLRLCAEYLMFISLPKSKIFGRQTRWCGRFFDKDGVTMDPSNFAGMRDSNEPKLTSS